jgi:hypothetical protein
MSDPVAHIPPLLQESVGLATYETTLEVYRQDKLARAGKFGGTHVMPGGTDLERLAVLAEEFGEASIEVCKGIEVEGQIRREGLRDELVQVAAVCVAWIAAIDEGRAP